MTRIKKFKPSDNTHYKPPISTHTYPNKEKPVQSITLLFDKEVEYRIYDEFHGNTIEKLDNDNLIVIAPFPEDDWLYGYLLSFAGHVTIIEPSHIRETFTNIVTSMAQKYLHSTH